MKAIVRTRPGKEFSSMKVVELANPEPTAGQLKLRMHAGRVHPVDMDLMKGFPTLKYKDPQIGGVDGAGTILAVGDQVVDFAVGDEVFFYRRFTDIGSWAEEIVVDAVDCAKIPGHMSLLEAGSVALPLLTAYESIKALEMPIGARVLIHGAGGGVGYQAVQVAMALGAKVIAHGSARDKEDLSFVGVEEFIDYRSQEFAKLLVDHQPDFVLDVLGGDTLLKSIGLRPKRIVSVSYMDTSQMHKTGVALPGFLVFIMKLSMGKFRRAAKSASVDLKGQVTGANGPMLAQAADLATRNGFKVRNPATVTIEDLEGGGMNLSHLGKTIIF